MCVDFTDLNKACPKDSYPLPWVDILVDSTTLHQLLRFMDAFLGYNQIRMDEADQEKTSFVTKKNTHRFVRLIQNYGTKRTAFSDITSPHIGSMMLNYITVKLLTY